VVGSLQASDEPTGQLQVKVLSGTVDPAEYRTMRYDVSGTGRETRNERANVRFTGPVPAVAVGVGPTGIVSVAALPWPLPVAVHMA
jgi:hypothetical protein